MKREQSNGRELSGARRRVFLNEWEQLAPVKRRARLLNPTRLRQLDLLDAFIHVYLIRLLTYHRRLRLKANEDVIRIVQYLNES